MLIYTLEILFWLCLFAIAHSYLIFPAILGFMARNKKGNQQTYESSADLPYVSILMAYHNEESVLEAKIESLLRQKYLTHRIEILLGSDASTDKSDNIAKSFTANYPFVQLFIFSQRQGKAAIINQLASKADGDILVLTDANVVLEKSTIYELVKHFKNHEIGLVDSHMINRGLSKKGISIQESTYISREVKIKYREGILWGTMMGPSGGCYAIRKNLYTAVPSNFLMDDFFQNMSVLKQGMKTISNFDAVVYEDVSDILKEEFRRKVRISTGNFQNLIYFKAVLFYWLLPFLKYNKSGSKVKSFPLFFSFLSHKVIRWFVPLLLIVDLVLSFLLLSNSFYFYFLFFLILTFILPIIDLCLRFFQIQSIILRFVTHFYSMNLALIIGFFKFLKGVKSNVWEPTKRNQSK
jgi:cellulose synthase/poly-beta-1,6-N-acetylglucosamine synthase-like glycosyltransferase